MEEALLAIEFELRVAKKLIFKNRNQHRATKHFAHFVQAVKALRGVDVKELRATWLQLTETFGSPDAMRRSVWCALRLEC